MRSPRGGSTAVPSRARGRRIALFVLFLAVNGAVVLHYAHSHHHRHHTLRYVEGTPPRNETLFVFLARVLVSAACGLIHTLDSARADARGSGLLIHTRLHHAPPFASTETRHTSVSWVPDLGDLTVAGGASPQSPVPRTCRGGEGEGGGGRALIRERSRHTTQSTHDWAASSGCGCGCG
jgi:hypothetical protein